MTNRVIRQPQLLLESPAMLSKYHKNVKIYFSRFQPKILT